MSESEQFPYLAEDERFIFPPVEQADRSGLLGVGGNLSPGMLLSAYEQGIFPWFGRGEPVMWWSLDPRLVFFPKNLKVSKSMKKLLKKENFTVTFNTAFKKVATLCAETGRKGQDGTWITEDMLEAYTKLHTLGRAHSVEVWQEGELTGGLYGVSVGAVFCGESMFHKVSNHSKVAFIYLVEHLISKGFTLIDCQQSTEHLISLGALEVSRPRFMKLLNENLEKKCKF